MKNRIKLGQQLSHFLFPARPVRRAYWIVLIKNYGLKQFDFKNHKDMYKD